MDPEVDGQLRMRGGGCGHVDIEEEAILGLGQRRGAASLRAGGAGEVGQDGAGGRSGWLRRRPAGGAFGWRGVADAEEDTDRGRVGGRRYAGESPRVGD